MRDMEAFLLIAMHESIAVRKEERSSTEVLASPFPRGLNLLRVRTRSNKRLKSEKNSFTCAWVYYCAKSAEGEEIREKH